MKHPRLLVSSILLNFLFLGAVLCWLAGQPDSVTPSIASSAVPSAAPSPATAAPFCWSQLEAGDYPTYIAKLRAIGCPEETIRDLITADLASQYEDKRRQLLAADLHQSGTTGLPLSRASEPLKPAASVKQPMFGSNTSLAASPPPVAPQSATAAFLGLAQEQTTLLASLLPRPAAPSADAPQAPPAGPKPTVADGPQVTSPAPARTPLSRLARDLRQRGVLTHEQEVLRAKVGFQAFYYTTKEENDLVRASPAQ